MGALCDASRAGERSVRAGRQVAGARAGETLPVRVLYDGKPLPGALITLGSLDRPKEPNTPLRTDASGEAGFTMPASGKWLLNVVWGVPAPQPAEADYKTTFSSLSFGL